MKLTIIEPLSSSLGRGLSHLFLRPFIAMLAWGAFVSMADLNIPTFGYWEFFMLNIAFVVLRHDPTPRWEVRDAEDK